MSGGGYGSSGVSSLGARFSTGPAGRAIVAAVLFACYQALFAVAALAAVLGEEGAYDFLRPQGLWVDVVALVGGCLWLRASWDFIVRIGPLRPMRRSPGWMWVAWWFPILCLWWPYQLVEDLRAATIAGPRLGWARVWWGSWILAAGAGGLASDVPDWPYVVIKIVGALLTMVSCVIWVAYVRELTRAQRRLLEGSALA